MVDILRGPRDGAAKVSSTSLTGKILCGYQGWFSFPSDGTAINKWKHWFTDAEDPSLQYLSVDMYPDTDEYDDDDLAESNILMQDGSYAKFYSAARPNVVLKHFEWMREYGISGAFHHRFMEGLGDKKNRDWKTLVLRNVRDAAEATGRVFAVGYDTAKEDDRTLNALKKDWIRLVDEEKITQSDRYLRHNGLPVLHVFGIGFKSIEVEDTAKVASFIDWLQNTAEEKYRVFLIGGVPSRWRERIVDSREGIEWKDIYDSLSSIHPWHVGRWDSIEEFNAVDRDIIAKDATYCAERNILYMPTMWPGFSWRNLQATKNRASPLNQVPRLGGRFLWSQAYQYAADANINTVWMAQFDEVDEGTAIYKVGKDASETPAEGSWLTLDADGVSLPNDWYLRLVGTAQKMLLGDIQLNETLPILPWTDRPTMSPTTSVHPTPGPTASPEAYVLNETLWLKIFTTLVPSASPSEPWVLNETLWLDTFTPGPSGQPSTYPTPGPSGQPSTKPSNTAMPSSIPSESPSISTRPSISAVPSSRPSVGPTATVTGAPTLQPTSTASLTRCHTALSMAFSATAWHFRRR